MIGVGLDREYASAEIVRILRNLASKPREVEPQGRATYDMLVPGITIEDVCDATCQWIDDGKPIEAKITTADPEHLGRTHYILKPTIDNQEWFVKLDIMEQSFEHLAIVSCHPLST